MCNALVLDSGVDLFEWDDENIRQIAAHGVTPAEAEQALTIAPLEFDAYVVDQEMRFEDFGRTASGRILKVLSVQKGDRTRVVTAYDATARAIKMYLRGMMT